MGTPTQLDPRWTAQIYDNDAGQDFLGLRAVQANTVDYLLPGIITTTPRARYYAFYSWLLVEYAEAKHEDWSLAQFIRRREQIFALAIEHAETPEFISGQIKLGHYYSNGKHGPEWQVRQIIDEASSDDPLKDMVIYRVIEGQGIRSADSCTLSEFAKWAVRELFPAKPA